MADDEDEETLGDRFHGDVLAVDGFEPDFHSLLRNLRDFVYIVDLEGRMMFMNTTLMHAMGYSVEEARARFLGQSFLLPLTPESRRVGREHFVKALRGETISPYFEIETICKDGSTILLEVHGSHYYRDGALVGRQGIARDITELRRLQRVAAERSERLNLLEERARLANELFNKIAQLSVDVSSDDLRTMIRKTDQITQGVHATRYGLDAVDLAILEALSKGCTNREIGAHVHLSAHTVKDRLNRLMERFECRARAALVAATIRAGVI